jgi:hypothetical protein
MEEAAEGTNHMLAMPYYIQAHRDRETRHDCEEENG